MNLFHFFELIFLAIVAYTHAYEELSLDGGNYVVEWKHLSATQEIEFIITVTTTGWVGLGISKENTGMKKMDVYIGGYNNGSVYLKVLYRVYLKPHQK